MNISEYLGNLYFGWKVNSLYTDASQVENMDANINKLVS